MSINQKATFLGLLALVGFLLLGLFIILFLNLKKKSRRNLGLRNNPLILQQPAHQPRNSIDSGVGGSRASSILGNGDDDSGISGFDVSIV